VNRELQKQTVENRRLRLIVRGAVQGVGFRPFAYRLAEALDLKGFVLNSAEGALVEVEGPAPRLREFRRRLEREKPPRSSIQGLEVSHLDPRGYPDFEIRPSLAGPPASVVMPDISSCSDCLAEIRDPADRRHLYPFTNCTNCGPRFSIIEALPYDRGNTTMKGFEMCRDCRAEFDNPLDRRFHAQPIACPRCGPEVALWDSRGHLRAGGEDALSQAARLIRQGDILALKGIGGFLLLVRADAEEEVQRLRCRKAREEKPFALMYPSLEEVEADCHVSEMERLLLTSPESPIVLLKRGPDRGRVASSVAPANPYLGVMLPYSPLHHLLMARLESPVVATSGNLSEEPICIDESEAVSRLGRIADWFLVHNRPIARHVDDSVVRIVAGRELVLRRARGYAPFPVLVESPLAPMLALGAHQKNTVAVSVGRQVFLSQHIGDLETPQANDAFRKVAADLQRLYEVKPTLVTCDLHPDYASTRFAGSFAERAGLKTVRVQHHYAHILSCMAENEVEGPCLGVSWDGTGYGLDHTIWGGEFLRVDEQGFGRVAHLRLFPLPGGERAVKEPRRSALGLLFELFGERLFGMAHIPLLEAFSKEEAAVLKSMLMRGVNSPLTSSAGRLFDAVAALAGLRFTVGFEGQAAMELEFAAEAVKDDASYPFSLLAEAGGVRVFDWGPLITAVLEDRGRGLPPPVIARRFHNTLAAAILEVARFCGEGSVLLSGGCFQNKLLTEQTVKVLEEAGFVPYRHQRVPPNDGGIALGQIMAAGRESRETQPALRGRSYDVSSRARSD
jgi:hydrogenase maturation protein HypF